MVGSAVAMMVWFSAERKAASIRPKKMVRTSAWLIAARGALAAATTSAGVAREGVAVPDLAGAARSVTGFRRFLTVIRTRARARAAALEKFIATNNPARGPQQKCVCRGDSCFCAAQQHRAWLAQFQRY